MASDMNNSKSRLKFMGPAQEEFDSLAKQAVYFLDNYWKAWRGRGDQAKHSYILPPLFKYKHPEVNDDEFATFQQTIIARGLEKPHDVITHRVSEEAEHIVYKALEQLIQDEIQAPFVVIRGLDLRLNFNARNQLHGALTRIFPQLRWEKFLEIMKETFGKETPNIEFDFVLIGPKIGMLVVEVKSSSFANKNYFKSGIDSLPVAYEHGLKQLEATKALIYVLEQATGISAPVNNYVRKILFTPNLKKARYDEWLESLTTDNLRNRDYVQRNVMQWFSEDLVEEAAGNRSLYFRLKQCLEQNIQIKDADQLYEAYCPILAAIASVILISGEVTATMNKVNFSQLEASQNEHVLVINQNPKGDSKAKLAACSSLQRASKEIKTLSKIVFLNLDQQKALQGSCRQLIFGAAGTGKTIILQAKAIDSLARGERVHVLATKSYMWRYKLFFDNCGFNNYKISDWNAKTFAMTSGLCKKADFARGRLGDLIDSYVEEAEDQENINFGKNFEWLRNSENVFIDDSLDEANWGRHPNESFLAPIVAMAWARKFRPSKLVWAAVDPYVKCDKLHQQILNLLLKNWIDPNHECIKRYCSVAILQLVMRCAENIFDATYKNLTFDSRPEFDKKLLPALGYKIQGTMSVKNNDFRYYDDALEKLWDETKNFIEQFSREQGAHFDLAIVVNDSEMVLGRSSGLCDFFREKCRTSFPQLLSSSPNETKVELIPGDVLEPKTGLVIKDWRKVSSMEWATVVFVSCRSRELTQDFTYQQYRAMSRATANLKFINFTYLEKEKDGPPIDYDWLS